MPEAAAFVRSSALAALQPGVNADALPPPAMLAKGAGPFAALLASATGTKGAGGPAKTGSADTLATLLTTAAPIVAAPIAINPAPLQPDLSPAQAGPASTGADPAPAEPDPASTKADTAPASADSTLVMIDPNGQITASAPVPVVGGQPTTTPETTVIVPAPAKAAPPAPSEPVTAAIPVAADAAPIDQGARLTAPKHKSHDKRHAPDRKGDRDDPLGDAIASGATAVLAFAPTIVTPPVQQDPSAQAAQVPIRIGGLVVAKPLKLPLPAPISAYTHAGTEMAETAPQAGQVTAQKQPGSDATYADRDAPRQPAPATKAEPAAVQLPSDIAKAVTAALKQRDTAPATATPTDPAAAPPAVTEAKTQVQPQVQPPAVPQPRQQDAPAQPEARGARHTDETPAPRRASDTRKRVDPMPADPASVGSTERAADPVRATPVHGTGDVHAKGDAIVLQTLSIARDGAWLDKLARDIAGAGSGGDLQFKLEPRNLGSLSVAISQGSDGASIRLTADNERTRDILVDAQPKLIAEAHAQGLKVSDTQVDVRQDQKQSQNQNPNQDAQRWAQNGSGQNGSSHNGQNRQSSPGHQPFVSNLGRKAEPESESPDRDSDALYA